MSNLEKLINDAKEEFRKSPSGESIESDKITLESEFGYRGDFNENVEKSYKLEEELLFNYWVPKLTQAYNQGKEEGNERWRLLSDYSLGIEECEKMLRTVDSLIKSD